MPRHLARAVIGLLTAIAFAAPGHAEDPAPIMAMHVWAPPSLAGARNGAAYLTLMNHGSEPERLLAISTPVAEAAEIHREEMTDGIMRMRPAGPLSLAPGESVTLAPGGLHVMLLRLKRPLTPGESFPLTLSFDHGGAMTVDATVENGGPRAEHAHH
jgi:periplasmic copper chaperone A